MKFNTKFLPEEGTMTNLHPSAHDPEADSITEQSEAEQMLWSCLKNLQIQFNRQFLAGPYQLDFYSAEKMLGIKVDEEQSSGFSPIQDLFRTRYLPTEGIHVIRFRRREILENIERVVQYLKIILEVFSRMPCPAFA
jgi:very-short-patch-repair endonuclease